MVNTLVSQTLSAGLPVVKSVVLHVGGSHTIKVYNLKPDQEFSANQLRLCCCFCESHRFLYLLKSLGLKASAKCPQCKCKCYVDGIALLMVFLRFLPPFTAVLSTAFLVFEIA